MLNLNKFYHDNNFKVTDSLGYGIYRNRPIAILPKGVNVKVTISFNKQITREQGSMISLKMHELKNTNRALLNAITTNLFVELIIYQSAEANEEFIPILDKVLDVLASFNLETCETCPLCGQALPSDSPFIRIKDSVIQAHDHCITQLTNSTNNMNQMMEQRSKKDLGKSLLLTISVMIIMTSFMVLLAFWGAYAFLSMLAGVFCYLINRILFMKFKIPYGKTQVIASTICSILAIIFSSFFGSIFYGATLLNIDFQTMLANYFTNLTMNNFLVGKNVLFDFLLSFVFLAIFNFRDLKSLFKKNEGVKRL